MAPKLGKEGNRHYCLLWCFSNSRDLSTNSGDQRTSDVQHATLTGPSEKAAWSGEGETRSTSSILSFSADNI